MAPVSQSISNQSPLNVQFAEMPNIQRPAWVLPVAVVLGIASGLALMATLVIGGLFFFGAVFAIAFLIIGEQHFVAISIVLITFSPLIGFGLYTPRAHRKIWGIILIIVSLVASGLGIALDSFESIGVGLTGAIILHSLALSGLALGNFTDRLASPARWRANHLQNNRCPRCLYDIRNLPEPRCPECGETF